MPNQPVSIPEGALIVDVQGLEVCPSERHRLQDPRVGGVILFSRNFESIEQLEALVASLRSIRPDLLLCVDQEGGRVRRFREPFTPFPPMQWLTDQVASMNRVHRAEALRSTGWLLAIELISVGIDLSFTPVLDLDYGHNQVIGDRAFGRTVSEVVESAGDFIEGLKAAGMVATGKHFPGHGFVDLDSHVALPTDARPYSALKQDMQPFAALSPKLAAIMTAHVRYPAVDEVPASFSNVWLQQQLRTKLGYKGVIVSDDLCMGAALELGDILARAQTALRAGCDLLLVCNRPDAVDQLLQNAEQVSSGQLAPAQRLRAQRPEGLPCFSDLNRWSDYSAVKKQLTSLLSFNRAP